jgi:hypothetical protein
MAFYGMMGPKGMPKEVVDKINAATRKVLQDPPSASASKTPARSSWATRPSSSPRNQGRTHHLQGSGGQAEADAGMSAT